MIDKILHYICVFLALIVVLPAHEFAHAFAAVKSGDYTPKHYKRYTLNPLMHFDPYGLALFVFAGFGWAKPVPVNPFNFKNRKWCSVWVASAGVTANYLISFIALPLYFLSQYIPKFGYFTIVIQQTLLYIYSFGLTFFVFNLLPLYPLDGFRIIDAFTKRTNAVYRVLRNYGTFILYGLILLSLIADFTGFYYIDVLGYIMDFLRYYVSYPILRFWGMIFGGWIWIYCWLFN